MIKSLEIANYRSFRRFQLKCTGLMCITGDNGVGKSNLYRAIGLLSRWAQGELGQAIAEEGGMAAVLPRGGPGKKDVHGFRLRLSVTLEEFSCEFQVGLPISPPPPLESLFKLAAEIKEETIWVGSGKPTKNKILAHRKGGLIVLRDAEGGSRKESVPHKQTDSVLSLYRDAVQFPVLAYLREQLGSWRFYHQFRSDADSLLRKPFPGAWTTSLSHSGDNLAAVMGTLLESTRCQEFLDAVELGFPGSVPVVERVGSLFVPYLDMPLVGPMAATEWSDGTLRFLGLVAALLPLEPAKLIVLNEPEASLHPNLIPALAALIVQTSNRSQIWVMSHSVQLIEEIQKLADVKPINLRMEKGQTTIHGLKYLYYDDDSEEGEEPEL